MNIDKSGSIIKLNSRQSKARMNELVSVTWFGYASIKLKSLSLRYGICKYIIPEMNN